MAASAARQPGEPASQGGFESSDFKGDGLGLVQVEPDTVLAESQTFVLLAELAKIDSALVLPTG